MLDQGKFRDIWKLLIQAGVVGKRSASGSPLYSDSAKSEGWWLKVVFWRIRWSEVPKSHSSELLDTNWKQTGPVHMLMRSWTTVKDV